MDLSRAAERAAALAERCASAIERRAGPTAAAALLLVAPPLLLLASRRPLWFDELFTLHVASLPDVAALRRALDLGIDHHPLPYWLVTRAALSLTGDPALGVRLPALAGFCAMAVCLHAAVARRTRPLYGLVAAAVPFATSTVFYATEGRPYGLSLGFAAAALLGWQRAAEGGRRRAWLAALALGVAGAISTSYYAVLIVAPLALGELVRTLRRGRWDAAPWAALAAGSAVCLVYLPRVARSVAGFDGPSWAEPHPGALPRVYLDLFGDASLGLVAVLALAGAFLAAGGRAPAASVRRPPAHELAAAVGFLLLPFAAWAVAELVTNRLTARYAIGAVLGLALLVGHAAYLAARGSALFGIALLTVCLGAFGVGGIALGLRTAGERGQELRALPSLLSTAPAGLPVAVDDPLRALELMYHAPPDVAARLVFLVDPSSSVRYGRIPYPGGTWLRMRDLFPGVRAERLGPFRRAHPEFLVYGTGSPFGWLVEALAAERSDLRLVAVRGSHRLYLARPSGGGLVPGDQRAAASRSRTSPLRPDGAPAQPAPRSPTGAARRRAARQSRRKAAWSIAKLPVTWRPGGTSRTTTAPSETEAPSPTRTRFRSVACGPIHTSSPIRTLPVITAPAPSRQRRPMRAWCETFTRLLTLVSSPSRVSPRNSARHTTALDCTSTRSASTTPPACGRSRSRPAARAGWKPSAPTTHPERSTTSSPSRDPSSTRAPGSTTAPRPIRTFRGAIHAAGSTSASGETTVGSSVR
jgi:hypothetical protein